jgi:hypothetical protein
MQFKKQKLNKKRRKKMKITYSRPFHNTAYNGTLRVDDDMLISKAQYNKMTLHHRKSADCQCGLEITDDNGNRYSVAPSNMFTAHNDDIYILIKQ